MLRSANNGMRRFGSRPPAARGVAATRHGASTPNRSRWLHFAPDWEGGVSHVSVTQCHTSGEDVPSTVVLMCAKSRSASSNARISVEQTKVKSLGRDNNIRGIVRGEDFKMGSQGVEHQDHSNSSGSEAKHDGGK